MRSYPHILVVMIFLALSAGDAGAQDRIYIEAALSSWDGQDFPEELYGFRSVPEAENALVCILNEAGLTSRNFEIAAANVPNAAAATLPPLCGNTTGPCVRALFYNPSFMQEMRDRTGNEWSSISIMAHEVGHLEAHTIRPNEGFRRVQEVQLTSHPDGDLDPAWSPDGRRIAFHSYRDGPSQIYVMNADGTGVTRLSPGEAPAWSPDGRRIAFASPGDGISVMNADGTGVTSLTSRGWGPAWSPDGRRIAFANLVDSGVPGIFVMNADGTGARRLTSTSGWGPAWSPDGGRIAFLSYRDDYFTVALMNADGAGGVRHLANHAGEDQGLTWSPDGRSIAFASIRDGTENIYVIPAPGP